MAVDKITTKKKKAVDYLWKESLNSDNQQFHQYQLLARIIELTNHHAVGNPVSGLGHAQKYSGVKSVNVREMK